MEFDSIKTELSINGWDAQKVIKSYKERNQFEFMLINCSNQSESFPIKLPRDESTEGMSIIRSL